MFKHPNEYANVGTITKYTIVMVKVINLQGYAIIGTNEPIKLLSFLMKVLILTGTTWTQEIVCAICSDGDVDQLNKTHTFDQVPFLEASNLFRSTKVIKALC